MPETPKRTALVSRRFWREFMSDLSEDELPALAAAIAYYATLSLAPLVLLSLAVIGALYPSAQARFLDEVGMLMGPEGREVVATIVRNAAARPDLRQLAGWSGGLVLLFGASAVFVRLQLALNRIWGLRKRSVHGLRGMLRRRLLSAGVLLAVLFLSIVSFITQGLLGLADLPQLPILQALWSVFGFLLYSALFTLLYRWLPDGRIPWWTAFRGGLITTLLFMLGHGLIGLYLSHTDTAGVFGPAGAIVVWLLWAFYSALVFLLSAEFLYALAQARGWRWAETGDIGRADETG